MCPVVSGEEMANLVDKAKNFVAEKVANMKKPEANLADVSVKGVSRDSAIFHGQVAVNNPYSHDLPIGEITYALKSADRLVSLFILILLFFSY